MCCSVSEWSFASQLPLSQCRMRTLSSPASVILLPPSPPALDCPPLPELELPRPPLPPPTFCARPPLPDVCSPAAAPPEPLLVAAPPVPLIAAVVESSSSPPHAQNSRHAIGQTIARRWVLTQSSR